MQQLFASDGSVMVAAAPMLGSDGRVLGIVVARTWRSPENAWTYWGIAFVSSIVPALCLVLPAALVVGLAFGYVTARGLTQHVEAVAGIGRLERGRFLKRCWTADRWTGRTSRAGG